MIDRRWPRFVCMVTAFVAILGAALPGSAVAYGTDHRYEITLLYNCQNVSLCVSSPLGIGGLWGWLEPDTGAMTGGALQLQGHQNTNPSFNGTAHSSWIGSWSIVSCRGNPGCGLLAAEGVPTDPNGQYFLIPVKLSAVGGWTLGPLPVPAPATHGHYNADPVPGFASSVTVTKLR